VLSRVTCLWFNLVDKGSWRSGMDVHSFTGRIFFDLVNVKVETPRDIYVNYLENIGWFVVSRM